MDSFTIGLAAFAKIPGMHASKTRLAANIGSKSAMQFYLHALSCVYQTMGHFSQAIPGLMPYWALPEADCKIFYQCIASSGMKRAREWNEFAAVLQGDGDLGEKIWRVYHKIKSKHQIAIIIGSDCPYLPESSISQVLAYHHQGADLVIGPAVDGGFYLLSGNQEYGQEFFRAPYSQSHTLQELLKNFSGKKIEFLSPLNDVDDALDLKQQITQLAELKKLEPSPLLSAHDKLLEWGAAFVDGNF